MLAAFFCGALFCTQALAKVCFVGDEECGSGASFEPAEELPTKTFADRKNTIPWPALAPTRAAFVPMMPDTSGAALRNMPIRPAFILWKR